MGNKQLSKSKNRFFTKTWRHQLEGWRHYLKLWLKKKILSDQQHQPNIFVLQVLL